MQRVPGGNLVGACEPAADDHVFQAQRPFSVIGVREIDLRRQFLDSGAPFVDGPGADHAHGAVEREAAAFPRGVKHRLVLLRFDFAEAVHAAHVMDAVHHAASAGFFGRPAPIMETRVTSVASFSSLQPWVPCGRIGSTMKRVSAVESHTRICVSAGSFRPKSASTPRGSLTARDRYGGALYQTGGRPSTSHG